MSRQPLPIFVSVGQQYQPEHVLLVDNISRALQSRGLKPQPLPRDRWNNNAPILPVISYLREQFGTIVVAFPRIHYEVVWEWPNSPRQLALESHDAASVWLQIEAALAFEMGQPTLILIDDRLRPSGMLNPKHEVYHAFYFNMDECCVALPEPILNALDDFALRVQHYAETIGRRETEAP